MPRRRLGPKLGVLLFQLGPAFKTDLPLFDAFLAELPRHAKAAFEFRHPSWLDDDVYERLRARNLALCIADSDTRSTPIVRNGQLRLLPVARRRLHRRRSRRVGAT